MLRHEQHGPAPLAAEGEPLHQPQGREQDGDGGTELLTVLAIVCAKETRSRDLADVEPDAGRRAADTATPAADARSV